jgi:ParB family chromosome partitioning protein
MFQTVKLAKLRLSPINVRTVSDDQLRIPEMAADIGARGVLQNLLVTPVTKPRGMFEVFDGGRRWRALSMLAESGAINPEEYDVPVLVVKADVAALSETSLAANFHQLKLTPAEECRAFQHFLGVDGDIDAVAKRFGQTRRFIEGRLRLATLAQPIFDALAVGEISLEIAKAYASTDSQDKQLLVWNSYSGHSYVNADTIRRAIVHQTMKATDPVALLVGDAAYLAAGGKIVADLFSEDGDRWVDPEIAERLAAAKLEAEATRIGEETGLAWIRPIATHHTYNAASGLYRVILPTVPMTEEEDARVTEIEDRLEAIQSEMEDEDITQEAYAELDAEFDRLDEERNTLNSRPSILTDELRPLVGAFLTLSQRGEMVLDTTYYSEKPIRLGADGNVAPDGETGDAGGGDPTATVIGGSGAVGSVSAPRPETIAPGGKPLTARLQDELAVQRRDVLAANLVQHPGLALDYAIFVMIDARNNGSTYYGTTVRARGPMDPSVGEMPSTRAREYLAECHDGLVSDWMGHATAVERFEAFRELDDDSKAAWLAYVVAVSLEAKDGFSGPSQNPLQNRLASIMDVDVAAWWRPTSQNFFDRVPKGSLLTLLHDVGGPALSGRYAASKKPDISASCHKLFAGEALVEADVKEAALAWVPATMRFLDDATDDTLAIADDEDLDQPGAGDDADGESVPLEPVERSDMPDAGDGEDLLEGETAEAA